MPLLVACAALATTACGRRVNLGEIGDGGGALLWSATFEPGNLSEWVADGGGGTYLENIMVAPAASSEIAHQGRFAGKVVIHPAMGMYSSNYFFRELPSPTEAYYSAWFYIPSSFTVKSWLSIIHFRGSHTGDGRNVFPTWDVNLYTRLDGSLVAHLYDYTGQKNLEQTNPLPVPLDTWVHFEVLFRKAADPSGHIAIWQDDVLILDLPGVVTAETPWFQWNVGGSSSSIDPFPGVMYVDDAAISLYRLGTSAP